MAAVAQATTNEITLRGSTAIVAEFFGYSINRCVEYTDICRYTVWVIEREREREREGKREGKRREGRAQFI